MQTISLLSDAELLERLPVLVRVEREATAEVIEHLVEVERRRLYLEQACANLVAYCRDRLGYPDDGAYKRARVAEVALRFPRALDELRSGALHLTALLLLASHLTDENADALFNEACGQSRRQIQVLLARRFGRQPERPRVEPVSAPEGRRAADVQGTVSGPSTPEFRPGAEAGSVFQLEPTEERYRFTFTASAEFRKKVEGARELASHTVPSGDVAELLERALDVFIEHETKRRFGAGKPRKQRALKPNSRHIPREVARQVFERDGFQCAFVDEGRRCQERRFLTIEHRRPFARGGPATVDNLSVFCSAHNAHTARQEFGEEFITEKRALRAAKASAASPPPTPDVFAKVTTALCAMGFPKRAVVPVMAQLRGETAPAEFAPLIRAALALLTPASG